MKVWIVEECPPYEESGFIGVYATEELANEAARRLQYREYIVVWDEDVVIELPPAAPVKPPYQVIP